MHVTAGTVPGEVLGRCARWFPQVVPGPPGTAACRYRPRMPVTAAAGMTVLLPKQLSRRARYCGVSRAGAPGGVTGSLKEAPG